MSYFQHFTALNYRLIVNINVFITYAAFSGIFGTIFDALGVFSMVMDPAKELAMTGNLHVRPIFYELFSVFCSLKLSLIYLSIYHYKDDFSKSSKSTKKCTNFLTSSIRAP